MRKRPSDDLPKITTVRIRASVLKAFTERVGRRKVSESLQQLMEVNLRGVTSNVDDEIKDPEVAEILTLAVTEALKHHKEWAIEASKQARIKLPSGMILRERMLHHYMLDKQYLAQQFATWLSSRIKFWLEKGKEVALFLDAGSAVLWLSVSLWSHLSKMSHGYKNENHPRILVYTNNRAVAESYALEEDNLRNFVQCELLGGTVEPRYAALIGEPTETRLEKLVATADSPARHISILAGNYIRMHTAGTEPVVPVPLIRGVGQRPVKERYVRCAHEAYIMGCIGKLFKGSTDEINGALKVKADSVAGLYEDVQVKLYDGTLAKVVTTIRTAESAILKTHSSRMHGLLGLQLSTESDLDSYSRSMNSIPHFCYPYDEPIKGLKPDQQKKVEFPHEEARSSPDFLKYYID